MRYVDDSKQELLVSTTQFPALVIAHQSYDKRDITGIAVLRCCTRRTAPCPS